MHTNDDTYLLDSRMPYRTSGSSGLCTVPPDTAACVPPVCASMCMDTSKHMSSTAPVYPSAVVCGRNFPLPHGLPARCGLLGSTTWCHGSGRSKPGLVCGRGLCALLPGLGQSTPAGTHHYTGCRSSRPAAMVGDCTIGIGIYRMPFSPLLSFCIWDLVPCKKQ